MHWLFERKVISFTGTFAVMILVFDLLYGRAFTSELIVGRLMMIIATWIVYAVIERINKKTAKKEDDKQKKGRKRH